MSSPPPQPRIFYYLFNQSLSFQAAYSESEVVETLQKHHPSTIRPHEVAFFPEELYELISEYGSAQYSEGAMSISDPLY